MKKVPFSGILTLIVVIVLAASSTLSTLMPILLTHPRDDEVAQYLVRDAIESDAVIDLVEQQLCAVDQHGIHVAHDPSRVLELLGPAIIEVKILLSVMSAEPHFCFLEKHICFLFRLCYTKFLNFSEFPLCFAHHNNTNRT